MTNPRKGWSEGLAHWRDGEQRVAFLSIAFTWRIPQARRLAEYYTSLGYRVKAGGPALFKLHWMMKDVAEIEYTYDERGNIKSGAGMCPDAVAHHNPFATKASEGCPVGCSFCIVTAMEGKEFTLLPEFEPRPILTDNNLSALPIDYQQYVVDRYRAAGVKLVDANSGFEPKTFDEECFLRWRGINKGPWRFGLDETFETADARRVIAMLRAHGVGARKIQVYVMIGHEPFAECMERIRQVIDMGGEPYVQPNMKLTAREKKPWVRHDWTPELLGRVQRWANGRYWKYTPFAGYDPNVRYHRQVVGSLI